jgi:hypothetical protein
MSRRHPQSAGRPKEWTEDRLWELYSRIILIQIRTGKKIMAACRDYATATKLDPTLVHKRFKQAERRPNSNVLVIRFGYPPPPITYEVVGSRHQLDALLRELKLLPPLRNKRRVGSATEAAWLKLRDEGPVTSAVEAAWRRSLGLKP